MQTFAARAGRYAAEIGSALRADLVLYAIALIYVAAGAVYVAGMGRAGIGDYSIYASGCLALIRLVLPYATLVLGAARIAFESKGRRSLAWRTLFSPRPTRRGIAG